jgi:hypothetical protein
MIYVDPPFTGVERDAQAKRVGAKHNHQWSHMWCDPGEEDVLHEMARKIGMKREWFQPHRLASHYDLVPTRRAHAVRLGAIEKPFIVWLREQKNKKPDEPKQAPTGSAETWFE